MAKDVIPLEPDCFYHIFNRGNNRENIFYNQENYRYFLRRYDQYLSNYLDTFCFCLLPNHFHLLVRIKPANDILSQAQIDFKKNTMAPEVLVSERFRRFFLSYSKSINKQTKRVGSLFQKPFRRKKVTDSGYLVNLVSYIHFNPAHHRVHSDYTSYPWSSYARILNDNPTKLRREELLSWFGGRQGFINFHRVNCDNSQEDSLEIE
ncbi:MAG: transposase [Bacteroidota bacterium]